MEKGVPMSLIIVIQFALAYSLASASDPSLLQDFYIATKDYIEFMNRKLCNDSKDAKADDFFFSRLDKSGDTSNRQGSNVTPVNMDNLAGLNTLGIYVARIDFAPYGLNPPHTHPCATEVIVVLEGTLHVGFVTSNIDNHLFAKVLTNGDIFVFLVGLIHFQWNMRNTNALVFAGLNNQSPEVIKIAIAVFGTDPSINPDVLTKAFQVDKNVFNYLKQQFN